MKSISYKIPTGVSLDCQLFRLVTQKTELGLCVSLLVSESASQQSIRHHFSQSSLTKFSYSHAVCNQLFRSQLLKRWIALSNG